MGSQVPSFCPQVFHSTKSTPGGVWALQLQWDNGARWLHREAPGAATQPCREPCRVTGPSCGRALLDPEAGNIIEALLDRNVGFSSVWGHRVKHPFGVWESDNSDGFEPHFEKNSWTLVANGSFTFATGQSAHHWRRMGVEFGQLAHQTQRLVREVSPWCLDCCPCGAPAFWGSGCDDFALDEPNLFCSEIKSPKFKVFQSFSFDQFPLFSFVQAHWKRLYIYIYLFHFPLSFYCWTPLADNQTDLPKYGSQGQSLEAAQRPPEGKDPLDRHAAIIPQFELNAYDALNALTMECDAFVEGDLLVTFPQCKDAEGCDLDVISGRCFVVKVAVAFTYWVVVEKLAHSLKISGGNI